MNVGIYTPFLDTLGGGERYILTIAEHLAQRYSVSILLNDKLQRWSGKQWANKIWDRLGINVASVEFKTISNRKFPQQNNRDLFSEYSAFFYMTDGTIFRCGSIKSILLIQKPGFLRDIHQNILDPLFTDALQTWGHVVCNSFFTKSLVKEEWGINPKVIYPPVNTLSIVKSKEKKHIILSVGRFFDEGHCKKQLVLVQVFRELHERGIDDWELYLVGGVRDDYPTYLNLVQDFATGLPITIIPNVPFSELRILYQQASIYWHATGFDEDSIQHPDRMEHFGIAPVEAMSTGCVPIVYGTGGLPEIVNDGKDGFLWHNITELKSFTLKLIEDQSLRIKMSKQAVTRSKKFDQQRFCDEINDLISLSEN